MNYLDLSALMPKLETASDAIKNVFSAEASRHEATELAILRTMDLIKAHADIPPAEITEKIETQFKALGVWPLNLDKTSATEVVYMGVVQAKAVSLAARIRERVYNLIKVTGVKNILTEDGLLQFHTVGPRSYIMNERNTTPEGDYTVGSVKGGAKSQAEVAKEANKTSSPRQPNASDKQDDPKQAEQATNARHAREALERIAHSFGHAYEAILAEHRILESMRAKLAKSVAGKEYLEAITPRAEATVQNMDDLGDHLHIVTKVVDGKQVYSIKTRS